MSKALTDTYIEDTYDGVIHSDGPLPASGVATLYDGLGTESSLSIGAKGAGIVVTGPFSVDGVALIDYIYPVGSIHMTLDTTSPTTLWPTTTWVLCSQGKYIAGIGSGVDKNSVNKTIGAENNDGEYQHTLTEAELATHNHDGYNIVMGDQGEAVSGFSTIVGRMGTYHQNDGHTAATITNSTASKLDGELVIDNAGNSTPFSLTPPTFGVYVWKRTA